MQYFTTGFARTFQEASAGALTNATYLFVKQAAGANQVELATAATDQAVGIAQSKTHSDDTDVPVTLLNAGTVKVKLGGTIAKGTEVSPGTGGKAAASATGNIVHGITLQAGVDGDVVEMIPCRYQKN